VKVSFHHHLFILQCVYLLDSANPKLVVIFRFLVREARDLGLDIIDRCNLTVLLEPGQEDLAAFLAEHRVKVRVRVS